MSERPYWVVHEIPMGEEALHEIDVENEWECICEPKIELIAGVRVKKKIVHASRLRQQPEGGCPE